MKKGKQSNEVFYVEKILDHREEGSKKLFLVKWADYGPEFNSWEPSESFLNSEVLKRYEGLAKQTREQSERCEMAKTERNQPKLTPISEITSKPTGARILTRQRKPTYKRSLIEKSQTKASQSSSANQAASVSNRSTPESSISTVEIQNDNDSMRSKRRTGRPRKYPISQNVHDTAPSTATDTQHDNNEMELEEFTLDKILSSKKVGQSGSSNASEDYPFELHRHNGLIGEEVNEARIDQLIKEMDESLERIDGYLLMDEPHNYFLSRLILIAKRPLGMVAYCRLEHNTMRSYRFECVPLEILIAKHPDDVLEYLQEQIKMDALNEYRKEALERNKSKTNGHTSQR